MMSKKKTNQEKKFFDFYYTELPAIAEYLEKQENQGYRLKEFDHNTMIFEKCEPRKIRYSAEIFKGSTPDDFIESCAQEGWELAGKYNNELYIFRTQKTDVIDIMTDENEKLKICAKRILHQPGTWSLLLYALLRIFYFLLDLDSGISITLFETDVRNYIDLLFIGLLLFMTLIKIFDYFLWRFMVFKGREKSPFFSLRNTINKRKIYTAIVCFYSIISFIAILWIKPEYSTYILMLFAVMFIYISYEHFSLIKLSFNKKDNRKKSLLTLITIVVIALGIFSFGEYNEALWLENSTVTFSSEDIPISLTDLGVKAKICEDKGDIEGTRFGQIYRFTSDAELLHNDENTSDYLFYNIFVSDYPHVRQKYVDKILEEYNDFEFEVIKVTPPETEWDYCYRIKRDSVNDYDGFAVKENLVVYLNWSVQSEKDFFKVAYEKLFAE